MQVGEEIEAVCSCQLATKNLDGFFHKARPQTSGTHFDSLGGTIDERSDGLNIWAKHPFGFIVGMTDIVPSHSVFSANRT